MISYQSTPQDTRNQFREEAPSHHWRTEIPNIVEDVLIDPYEFRVYMHIKRRAGDGGTCFESNQSMADKCGMGKRKLILVKQSLATPRKELEGRPLILIQKRTTEKGDPDTDLITIVDLWGVNLRSYYSSYGGGGGASGAPGVVHEVHEGGASGAPKEEHYEEEPTTYPPTPQKEVSTVDRFADESKEVREFLSSREANADLENMLQECQDEMALRKAVRYAYVYDKMFKRVENVISFIRDAFENRRYVDIKKFSEAAREALKRLDEHPSVVTNTKYYQLHKPRLDKLKGCSHELRGTTIFIDVNGSPAIVDLLREDFEKNFQDMVRMIEKMLE